MTAILIQGIGGIGGLFAAELLRAKRSVTLITNNQKITDAINENGISLTTPDDAFSVPAHAHTSLDELPLGTKFDQVYSTMMAGSVVESASMALPYLAQNGFMVSFQNGFVEEAMCRVVGKERVVGATVALGSTMEQPGIYRRTTQGRLIIGELDGRSSPRLKQLADVLGNIVTTEISTNITGVLWGKLVWNGAVSCLCAISGLNLGALFDCEVGRRLFLQSFRESVEAARAQGVAIEPVIVEPEDYYVAIDGPDQKREAVLRRLEPLVEKYANVTPSTLVSLQRGRKSEIDFLNGYILEKAIAAGVPAPLNTAVIPMVHEIEAGLRKLDPANLDQLYAAIS